LRKSKINSLQNYLAIGAVVLGHLGVLESKTDDWSFSNSNISAATRETNRSQRCQCGLEYALGIMLPPLIIGLCYLRKPE
jgi:hypothetical protein